MNLLRSCSYMRTLHSSHVNSSPTTSVTTVLLYLFDNICSGCCGGVLQFQISIQSENNSNHLFSYLGEGGSYPFTSSLLTFAVLIRASLLLVAVPRVSFYLKYFKDNHSFLVLPCHQPQCIQPLSTKPFLTHSLIT